jgi:hypothetical protein
MKEKIQAFLSVNENWRKFINAEAQEQKEAKIISVDVTTYQLEEEQVSFDVSLVYTVKGSGQKQSYQSGTGLLDEKGNITEVHYHLP